MTSIHNPGNEFTAGPGEPIFPSYELVSFGAWFAEILALSETSDTRPRVIAVDGRGSGCIRTSLTSLYDATAFVQSDLAKAKARGVERDVELGVNGGREEAEAFLDSWASEEISFMEKTRPWHDADFVVVGHAPSELPEGMVTIDGRCQRFLDQLGDECLVVATIDEEM